MQYFSIPIEECFMWRDKKGSTWNPLNNFITGLRIFEPYTGFLEGIDPILVKNKIYVTSGELEGNVVGTVISSDYEIIYQDDDGTEGKIIRLRYYPEGNDRNEVISIEHEMTNKVKNGDLLVGYNVSDAKKLK
jgi:hypothetical protein